jgi:phage shock protein PspC (stress-responsive transcriptional regulator)
MKKTLTINLNKKVFHIDEDAYLLLDNYLQNLRNYFRKEQGVEEIMTDFEGRIEEILSEEMGDGVDVASVSDVENVIRQMGNPGDFGMNSSDGKGDSQFFTTGQQQNNTSGKKKLYRNPDNKILGGVCSGIAASFGWDVTWVRLATVLLFFLSFPVTRVFSLNVSFMPWWLVILYIVLWIILPTIGTTGQRPGMSSKPLTVENIGNKAAGQARTGISNHESNNGCLSVFLKVCLVIFAIITGIPALFVLVFILIVLFAVIFGVGTGVFGGLIPFLDDGFLAVQKPVLAAISGFLFIGIPLVSLIYVIISAIFKWKPIHKSIKITVLVVWIVSVFLLLFSDWKIEWRLLRHGDRDHDTWVFDGDRLNGDGNITERTETFSGAIKKLEIKGYLTLDLKIDSLSGNSSELMVEGDSNIINRHLYIDQSGEKLLLHNKKKQGIKQSKPYKLILKTSGFERIEITGAANLEAAGLNMEKLEIKATGASLIKMPDVNIVNLEINCTGASLATLTGHVTKVKLKATGASHIQANELTADTVYANATGASKIKCCPVAFLDATAKGVSHITYHSEPAGKSIISSGASSINAK